MTFNENGAITLNIMTLSIMIPGTTTLSLMTISVMDLIATISKILFTVVLSVVIVRCCNAEHHHAECYYTGRRYTECHYAE